MKRRFFAVALTFCVLVSMFATPAAADSQTAANSQAEQQYEDLSSVADLIKSFGLYSSQDDNPMKNMMIKLLEENPNAFYTLANIMLSYYDAHSMYVKASDYATAFPTNLGGYVGVGITISTDGGKNVITYVTPQGPADQAGILAGDVLVAIDGKKINGLTSDEIANQIRGAEGTPVTLTVDRNGKEYTFTMNRKQIGTPNFEEYTVEQGIEYMRLTLFNGTDTMNRFNAAYSQLAKKGTKALILDLRGNPGGLVDMAEQIINAFVPDKDKYLFAAKNRNAANGLYTFKSDGTGIKLNNIYILVDKNSASASEITAGSLRDLGYAKIVGTNTYGKSTGQIHFRLANGDALIITVQQHVLPGGEAFEGVGLTPDYSVENHETNYPIPADLAELKTDTDVYLTNCSERTLAIEQRLKLLGYFNGTADDNFDQGTLDAVDAFQKANDLPQTNYCPVQTIQLLGQKIAELAQKKVTVDAQFNKALELARLDAKKDLQYTVDQNGKFINKK